jgi:hypothetical protein
MERGMRTMNLVHRRIITAVKRVEFINDRMSYIILRGHWFHIIVLNAHASTEDKTEYVKDSIYEELERIFDKFPKYHMTISLGDFNAKVGREDSVKPIIGNESLHEIFNDIGIRVVKFATSKHLIVNSTTFPHPNIHKYLLTSPYGNIYNQIDHIPIDRRRHSSVLDVQSFRAADCDLDYYLVVATIRERIAVNKQGSHKY